jgi:hypothetical protein
MAIDKIAAIAYMSIAASAIGTGVSYYGQRQAANSAAAIADYNARVQERNASAQLRLQLAQAELNKKALDMQAAAQEQAARLAFQNAEAMRMDADAQSAIDRAEREKARREHLRLMATQRAKVAGSGMVESGSPLMVLAETARLTQLDIEEQAYASDLDRRARLREADLTEFQGRQGLFEAGMTRFNKNFESLNAASARAGYANTRTGIRLGLLGARADASAARIGANASLLSGLGSAGTNYYYARNELPKARGTTTTTQPVARG